MYARGDSVVFLKTKEAFGGLSNMAGGFPLKVNGIRVLTSEALYQACRFPHLPNVQKLIISQRSPMTAKMKGKPHRTNSRSDWDRVRVKIMRWCLRGKLAQNWATFSRLLLETGKGPIVEESRRDAFWGAKPIDEQTLVGMNVLGRLLMELREEVKSRDPALFLRVGPLGISDFRLYGQQIQPVEADGFADSPKAVLRLDRPTPPSALPAKLVQTSLFDQIPPNTKTEPWRKEAKQAGGSMDELKPYPSIKDSGVKWLGEAPGHWEVLPNRAVFDEIKERNCPDEPMLSVTIRRGVIRQAALLEGSSKKDSSNLDRSNYKLVEPGDIAYNKMRVWQGSIGVSDCRGIVSPAYVVMRLRATDNPRYFHYLFRTPHFAKEAERWSYGITSDMWSLRPEHFKMIYSPLPPKDEQTVIVKFLDLTSRRLDRAVRAKQKLISLLNEQKQVIIHRAVARGLDPDVPLKPSHIPWLGDIPKHWGLVPLKTLCNIQSGVTLGKYYLGHNLTEYPYLRVANVQAGHLDLRDLKSLQLPPEEANRYLLRDGDVLMTEGGDPDKLGRGCVWDAEISPCLHQNHIFAVRPDTKKLIPKYLSAILCSDYSRNYFQLNAKQTTNLASTNKSTIGRFHIPLPSLREQEEILIDIERSTSPINQIATHTERQISLFEEYRTRLVADVVTGRLDVREMVRGISDEAEPDDLAADDVELPTRDLDELDAGMLEYETGANR